MLAPTGTIGFMMDCDTTGVEPDLALIKFKKLVGGGMIKIVNNTVPAALFKLGYSQDQTNAIVSYIDATGTIEGAPQVKEDHLAVFDCSFKPTRGTRTIHYLGHLKMMAAVQPFISGAISKTINMPEQATVEEVMEAYIEAWRLGLKAVAIYRDGSKKSQPLSSKGSATAESKAAPAVEEEDPNAPPRARRHKLPDERFSVTHKFNIAGHEGYITVGLYPERPAGRNLHHHGQGGFHRQRPDGCLRHRRLHRLAARRAAQTALRQIRAPALRAQRLEPERTHRLRQVDHGLHLPLAGNALPHRTAAVAVRRPAPARQRDDLHRGRQLGANEKPKAESGSLFWRGSRQRGGAAITPPTR